MNIPLRTEHHAKQIHQTVRARDTPGHSIEGIRGDVLDNGSLGGNTVVNREILHLKSAHGGGEDDDDGGEVSGEKRIIMRKPQNNSLVDTSG